jgi:hypothetical protein
VENILIQTQNNHMKKLSFLFLFVMLASLAIAQQGTNKGQKQGQHNGQGNKHKTPEEKAEAGTRKLTGLVNLTSDQQPKVKDVLLTRAQKVQSIREKYANTQDKSKMHTELKAVKTESDNSLKSILTPDQYTQYEKAKQDAKNKHQKSGANTSNEPVQQGEHDDLDVD